VDRFRAERYRRVDAFLLESLHATVATAAGFREFVRPGIAPKEMSSWLHQALKARLAADYGELPVDSEALAGSVLRNAERFVEESRARLPRFSDPSAAG
jgi:uncharacterized protein (UPF0332 family)